MSINWVISPGSNYEIGEVIGKGNHRTAYSVVGRDDIVIKENTTNEPFNYVEIKIYQSVLLNSLGENFAKIIDYSSDYRYLVMEKVEPAKGGESILLPVYLSSLTTDKFGTVTRDGRKEFVIFDYADVALFFNMNTFSPFKRVAVSDDQTELVDSFYKLSTADIVYDRTLKMDNEKIHKRFNEYFGVSPKRILEEGSVRVIRDGQQITWVYDDSDNIYRVKEDGSFSKTSMKLKLLKLCGLDFLW